MDILETMLIFVGNFSRNFGNLRKFLNPKIYLTLLAIPAFCLNEKIAMALSCLIVENFENLRLSELLGRRQGRSKVLRGKVLAFSDPRIIICLQPCAIMKLC